MKQKKNLIIVAILFLLIVIGANYLIIRKKTPRIAYVNSAKMLENYNALLELRTELAASNNERAKKIEVLESSVKSLIEQYELNNSSWTKTKTEAERQLILKKQDELKKFKEIMAIESQEEDNKKTMQLIRPVELLIGEYADKKHYDFVLGINSTASILYANKAHDITDEIIELINQ